MSFRRLFDEQHVILEIQNHTKDEALREMVEHLGKIHRFPKKRVEALVEAILDREAQGATGIGKGVALPHAKHPELKQIYALLARCSEGLDFNAADHQPVHVLFLVLSPETNPEEHIKFLRWISYIARQKDFRSFFLQARNVEEALGLLDEFGPRED